MEERLTRYELGMIQRMHDEQDYRCATQEHIAKQLRKIGLPTNASRFQVAEKVRELERRFL